MANFTFYVVDVFAKKKYAGNQLAVIRGAAALSDLEMQQIAKEMNYSETTFLLSDEPRDGGFDVRIFTPEEELPFAGHPTLGSAYVIQQEILQAAVPVVKLNLKAGQIPVRFTYHAGQANQPDLLEMQQLSPSFGPVYGAERIAQILQLDVGAIDTRYPIQEVSTGLPALIVPLTSLEAVKQSRVHRELYEQFVNETDAAKAVLVFAPETYQADHQLNVRVFVDLLGIPEDPATGSANGCLAGYLTKYRYFGEDSFQILVEQGYEIGRPSLLQLTGRQMDSQIQVLVGGSVILIAKGELL